MKENMIKYANIILNTCLKVEKEKPLFISCNSERKDFVDIVVSIAKNIGIKDIYLDIVDVHKKHELLKELEISELKHYEMFNKTIWNEYAKKESSFLMLASETPGLMDDIDPKKLNEMITYMQETRKEFDDLRDQAKVPWCIAAVPTLSWAKEIFPDSTNPVNDLWDEIFKICLINENNPEESWNKKIERLENNAKILNEYQFESLRYSNDKGTNVIIGLPKNHIWETGYSKLSNGKKVLVNFPTEEVFTSPDRLKVNGTVYNSKPLCYQDNIIDDFNIIFKEGKAVSVNAVKGEPVLKELINSTLNMDYLGEVSLVEKTSSINKTGLIFYETLFDENAACHLALGASFPECIKNGNSMSKEELLNNGMNDSLNHVDFMIGTDDLKIYGTKDKTEYIIFENGIFVLNKFYN